VRGLRFGRSIRKIRAGAVKRAGSFLFCGHLLGDLVLHRFCGRLWLDIDHRQGLDTDLGVTDQFVASGVAPALGRPAAVKAWCRVCNSAEDMQM
jgi:hypothetical protein